MNCTICAPPNGKRYALMTASRIDSISPVHLCGGRAASSRVVSYHSSRDAAIRACRALRRIHGQARAYVIDAKRGRVPLATRHDLEEALNAERALADKWERCEDL
jgi:hypothetical protein